MLAKARRASPQAAPVTATVTREGDVVTVVLDGMLLASLSNTYNWRATNRIKQAQSAVLRPLLATLKCPPLPLDITITRIAWQPVDPRNLDCCGKRPIDDLARWTGVDDAREDVVRYTVTQETGATACKIVIRPMNTATPPTVSR